MINVFQLQRFLPDFITGYVIAINYFPRLSHPLRNARAGPPEAIYQGDVFYFLAYRVFWVHLSSLYHRHRPCAGDFFRDTGALHHVHHVVNVLI
jgi:hypothetical protein